MNENVIISVICTVKNGENTVSSTVESVLQQTFEGFELIIVDDGSTDSTLQILKKIQNKDHRIKIVETGGVGRGEALNLAINKSIGKYVANVDADDLFHPQKLAIQLQVFNNNPELFLLSTKGKLIYEYEEPRWEAIMNTDEKVTYHSDALFTENSITHTSVMMNRTALKKLNGYDNYRTTLLDYDLWLRAYTSGYLLANVENVLTAKRIHENQSFENKERLKYTFNNLKLQMKYLKISNNYQLILIIFIRFILAQLPFSVRNRINKMRKNK